MPIYTLIPTAAGDCGEETWDSAPPRRTESDPEVSDVDKPPARAPENGELFAAAEIDDDDRGLDASDTGDVGYCPRRVGYNVAAAAVVGKSRRDSEYTPLPPPDVCDVPYPAAAPLAFAPAADDVAPANNSELRRREARSTRASADADAVIPELVVGLDVPPDKIVLDPASASVSLQSSMTERRRD